MITNPTLLLHTLLVYQQRVRSSVITSPHTTPTHFVATITKCARVMSSNDY